MNESLRIPRAHFIRSSFGPGDLLPSLVALWDRRGLLWHMTIRHLRGQYKQSVLGYAWAFVNPLSQMLILSFVFSQIIRVQTEGIPYPLFVLMGLLPWIFFSTAVSSATDSITGAASLVTKVYFPRELLPTAAVLTKVVDLAFGLLILISMMVYFGYPPQWTLVWVPLLFLIHLIFTLGLAFPLAALNLFFHDVRFLVGVALTLWFYLTPVIYPVDLVPQQYQILFDLNPNSLFINAYRRVVIQGITPGADRLLLGLAVALITFIVGYYLFKRMEPRFADRI
ncbi:MAG: ABC transporter permease [Chloroflexi bacterium]|nr:ABC transporter permease [Chloroflexota bacterium]